MIRVQLQGDINAETLFKKLESLSLENLDKLMCEFQLKNYDLPYFGEKKPETSKSTVISKSSSTVPNYLYIRVKVSATKSKEDKENMFAEANFEIEVADHKGNTINVKRNKYHVIGLFKKVK